MSQVWSYFQNHQSQIGQETWTTVWLAALPLLIGTLIALPVGWWASRTRWLYLPLITTAGILYTIPSIVLFVSMPGLIGTKILAPENVAIALTVYTFALMVRVSADAFGSVSGDAMSAAAAMGFTTRQRLFSVQLPIAVPVLGAGIRVAAVSNVSLVSVASTIGVAQLGSLFIEGNQNSDLHPIVLALILFVLLALVFDGLVLLGIRLLTPWQRAVTAR
ncbi:MAG: osmoprotectant transport system permease protein [Frankiales bacterium]|jgi:osmoprotectant transport system permease protein|nr:osmoprotectant transport system permease protein [Frankiales bacterium]MDX6246481.1 osmoprotectant transport system permease protein [Frankiales bacterium]